MAPLLSDLSEEEDDGNGTFAWRKAAAALGGFRPPMIRLEIVERIDIMIVIVSFC
jgi:hypothetical protein